MKSNSVTIKNQGPPSVMKLSEVDIAGPKEGEVLIRQSVIKIKKTIIVLISNNKKLGGFLFFIGIFIFGLFVSKDIILYPSA